MGQFVYLLAVFSIAVSLITAFFAALPQNPFANAINDAIAFLMSDSVAQGLSWLAWFFPIANFVNWIPAVVNAVIAFKVARLTLLVLKLL